MTNQSSSTTACRMISFLLIIGSYLGAVQSFAVSHHVYHHHHRHQSLRFYTAVQAEASNTQHPENDKRSSTTNVASDDTEKADNDPVNLFWTLLRQAPANRPTPVALTREILALVRQVERQCPATEDPSQVLPKLAGTWELVWTAQDDSAVESNRGPFSWINPLENQSYSNNSQNKKIMGRSNPVLPRDIQDRLEASGFLETSNINNENHSDDSDDGSSLLLGRPKSTQTIDLKKQMAINVVSLQRSGSSSSKGQAASLTVNIAFTLNTKDPRRVDVHFQSCRVSVPSLPLFMWWRDFTIPLGPLGVRGWLRTTYIDDTFRITRGHKGSVFVLARPAAVSSKRPNSSSLSLPLS